MGSDDGSLPPAQREKYVDGLKQIIANMRRDKVKDFNVVATAIAAYRRDCLEGSNRLMPL